MSETVYDITDDVKRDVLAATDLVQLIGATTSLKKAGRSWKGLCPFHTEKSASFHVHPDKGFYYCFGCGAKGDAIIVASSGCSPGPATGRAGCAGCSETQ